MYIAGLVLKKLLETYKDGVNGQEADADKKAKMIYDVLDANPSKFRVRTTPSYILIPLIPDNRSYPTNPPVLE